MRLGEYLALAGRRLQKAGADSPRLCAQVLAENLLGLSRLECVLATRRELDSRWATLGVVVMQCTVAWVVSFLAYAIAGAFL